MSFEAPLEWSDYHLLYVRVVIAGRECLASIDTGSFRSVEISSTLARELKFPLETTSTIARRHGGREFPLQKGRIASLAIGKWETKDVSIDVAEGDIEAIAAQVGVKFDVILGWGFFGQFPTQVDYPVRKLRWGAPFPASKDDLVIPFEVVNRIPIVTGRIAGQEIKFLLDTGGPMCLLGPPLAEGAAINEKTKNTLRLGGKDFALEFRVKDLAGRSFAGVIGNNLLVNYRVTFDPEKKEIRLGK